MAQLVPIHRSGALRSARLKLIVATALAVMAACLFAVAAHAGTDTWCNNCTVSPGSAKVSTYDHHFTLIYSHDVDIYHPGLLVGAGVQGCYDIAHGYGTATHSYATPCLAYGIGENTAIDGYPIAMNIHGDY